MAKKTPKKDVIAILPPVETRVCDERDTGLADKISTALQSYEFLAVRRLAADPVMPNRDKLECLVSTLAPACRTAVHDWRLDHARQIIGFIQGILYTTDLRRWEQIATDEV